MPPPRMSPSFLCRECGVPLRPEDRFCSACGKPVGRPAGLEQSDQPLNDGGEVSCPLCGQRNQAGSAACLSCGAALPGRRGKDQTKRKEAGSSSPVRVSAPLRFLQSWKLTAALAAALIITVVVITRTGAGNPADASLSPQSAMAIREIEELQKTVEENPNDAQAELRLANLYHDTKMYSKAVVIYDRYLQLNPSDPDARVDMGICYFQMSFSDSSQSGAYLQTAVEEMKKALTYQPKHQLACFNLGIISFHTGDTDEAYSWLKRCVAIDSTSEVGRRAQQFLNQHSPSNRSTS